MSAPWPGAIDSVRAKHSDTRQGLQAGAESKLQRVHGVALSSAPAEAVYLARQQIASESKQRVGKVAADLMKQYAVIILDGGTTTLQLIQQLPLDHERTVVTHSPTIAVARSAHTFVQINMIGGVRIQCKCSRDNCSW